MLMLFSLVLQSTHNTYLDRFKCSQTDVAALAHTHMMSKMCGTCYSFHSLASHIGVYDTHDNIFICRIWFTRFIYLKNDQDWLSAHSQRVWMFSTYTTFCWIEFKVVLLIEGDLTYRVVYVNPIQIQILILILMRWPYWNAAGAIIIMRSKNR